MDVAHATIADGRGIYDRPVRYGVAIDLHATATNAARQEAIVALREMTAEV